MSPSSKSSSSSRGLRFSGPMAVPSNPDNVVKVPAFTTQPSPNESEGSNETSPSVSSAWSMANLIVSDEPIGVKKASSSEDNFLAEWLVSVPFVREAHILNAYVLGDSPSKPFRNKDHVFKPVYKPEEEWISFSVEVAKFLLTTRRPPLDPHQLASLLIDNLSNRNYRYKLSRISPEKVFTVYQNTWYGIEEAARDYKRFHACGANVMKDGEKFARHYLWMASNPKSRVMLCLYCLSAQNLAVLRVKHPSLFDLDSGAFLVKDSETDKIELLTREVIHFSYLTPCVDPYIEYY